MKSACSRFLVRVFLASAARVGHKSSEIKNISFFSSSSFNPLKLNMLSITGRDQTGYNVHAGFNMFPQSCDLRTETAGSL
jgi:hypothetical protein